MDINQIPSAYMRGQDRDVVLALYRECPVEAQTSDRLNLLHIAVRHAHPQAVAWLLEQGFDPNEPGGYGEGEYPLFMLAKAPGSRSYRPEPGDIHKTACLLLDARAGTLRKDDEGRYCYHHAAGDGNHEFLQALLDKGVKMAKADERGNTGLHLAAEATYNPVRDLEKARAAVQEKLNEADLPPKRRSPVSLEELEGRVRREEERLESLFRCCRLLLEAGCDPEAKNRMGETAHYLAMRRGAKKIAALLDGSYAEDMEGEDAQARLAAGGMTLHQAVRQRDPEAIRATVELGADVNEVSDDEKFRGLTPLATACQVCDLQSARLLLELGADPNRKSDGGRPAIAYLFTNLIDINPRQDIFTHKLPRALVRLMQEKGWELDGSVNDRGDTLLCLALGSPYGAGVGRDSVKYMVADELLRLGALPDRPNNHGQTPLMLACGGKPRTVEPIALSLLEAGADPAARDRAGNTPLHYAAQNATKLWAATMAELLLDFGGADVEAVNNEGKTALDYATTADNEALVKLILETM